jgi:hypothetical protein
MIDGGGIRPGDEGVPRDNSGNKEEPLRKKKKGRKRKYNF